MVKAMDLKYNLLSNTRTHYLSRQIGFVRYVRVMHAAFWCPVLGGWWKLRGGGRWKLLAVGSSSEANFRSGDQH